MSGQEPAVLVDINWHVIAPPAERAAYPLTPVLGTAAEFTEDQTTTVADCLALMAAAGVHQAFVIGSRFHGFDNRYCADSVVGHADRLVGIANIDVSRDDAVRQVDHWVGERGLHGVRLWNGRRSSATWVDEPWLTPVWRRIQELRIPANAQTTTPAALPATTRLLAAFPALRLTVNHLGHVSPDVLDDGAEPVTGPVHDLLALAEYRGVHVNLPVEFVVAAAQQGSSARRLLELLLARFGPQRLMWSAFYPSWRDRTYPASIALLRASLDWLDEDDRAWLLGRSAHRLQPSLARPDPGPATRWTARSPERP